MCNEVLFEYAYMYGLFLDDYGNKIIIKPHHLIPEKYSCTIIDNTGHFHSNLGFYPEHYDFIEEYYRERILC